MAQGQGKTRKATDPGLPGWAWGLMGLAVGLTVAAVIYLVQIAAPPGVTPDSASRGPQPAEPASEGAGPSAGEDSKQQEQQEEQRFDFYELLPDFEVVVPERDSAPERSDTGEAGAAPERAIDDLEPGKYMLQVGAFRNQEKADRLKANLALLGIESSIETVTIEREGESGTFHRVRVGPISDLERLEKTRARLREEDYESVLIRVQG